MKVFVVLFALASLAYSSKFPAQLKIAFSSGDIIDGVNAQSGEAPYIVSLQYGGSHFCAGSIINKNWVVTAAHCLIYKSFTVIAGLHVRSDLSGTQIRSVANKSQYIAHEKFGGGVGPFDIGVIYIQEPFDLTNAKVRSIELPTPQLILPGDGTIFGWGKNRAGVLPQILQKLDTRVIDYSQCKKALPSFAPIAIGNICTHYKGNNKYEGACNGDSGGPLVKYTESGVYLIGLVSWGYTPCATSTRPSVFTSTAAYAVWVNNTIANYKP